MYLKGTFLLLKQGDNYMDNQNKQEYIDDSGIFNATRMSRNNGLSANVKLSDWFKYDLLCLFNLIPVFGNIAYIIIAFVIAFGSKTAPSIKTRMQMNFIWAAVIICLEIIAIIVLLVLGVSFANILPFLVNN